MGDESGDQRRSTAASTCTPFLFGAPAQELNTAVRQGHTNYDEGCGFGGAR